MKAADSNLHKSRELHSRLTELLITCDPADMPFYNKRLYRPWVAEKIGCSPATLTTSPRLRNTLTMWEKDNKPEDNGCDNILEEYKQDEEDSSVVTITTWLVQGLIRPVDIVIKGKIVAVPMLYWPGGLDELVCDYLRYLRVNTKKSYSTADEVAKKLRIFRRFQRTNRLKDQDVTDDFLIAWQHSMEARGIRVNRRNDCITTVHSFFEWAEICGHLKNHVQLAPKPSYSAELGEDYVFPIASKQITIRRKGQEYHSWVSTLIEPGGESSFGKRHTPTSREIERLFLAVSANSRNSMRNGLIISWALQAGGRISEILQVKVEHLPTRDEIGSFIDRQTEYLSVVVDRKNRGEAGGELRVPVELVISTLDYVWNDKDREKIVERHGDCGFVFLSETGNVLTTDSVTRICGEFFRIAEIPNANIHRLRARFITEVIEGVLDDLEAKGQTVDLTSDWGETVLIMARNLMGHSHIMSLRPYLTEIQVRRIRANGTIIPREEAEPGHLRKELDQALDSRVNYSDRLAEADRLMGAGKTTQVAQILRVLADEIDESSE